MEEIKTCEFVSPGHPDKICDFIADSVLDEYLKGDPKSRVAVEVLGGHGVVTLTGEVTSSADCDVESVVKEIVSRDYEVRVNISKQSSEISRGVDTGGAGDQGLMIRYAANETETFMPREYEIARSLCQEIYEVYPSDGKTQVTIRGEEVLAVVASFQNTKTKELEELVRSSIKADRYLINPAGEWRTGGFDADSGLSGRKIVVDNYGPEVSVGGGSFSGKDPTKVDRSAAYMARHVAVDLLKKHKAQVVKTRLAYAIGIPKTLMAQAVVDGEVLPIQGYDLTPQGIINFLGLDKPIYKETARFGHMGRGFPWG